MLARREADAVFALFFEANGLAATGLAPYRRVVPQLVEAWIDWAAELLEGDADTPSRRGRGRPSRSSTACCCSVSSAEPRPRTAPPTDWV